MWIPFRSGRRLPTAPVMQYAKAQKEAGHIRFLGVSSHNPEAALAAVESGSIDVLMFTSTRATTCCRR